MDIKAIVSPDPDGGYRAEVPGLPGVAAQSATLDALRPALRDALAGWIEAAQGEALGRLDVEPDEVLTLELDLVEPCPLDHTPNAETVAAIEELERGEGTRYESFDDFRRAMMGG